MKFLKDELRDAVAAVTGEEVMVEYPAMASYGDYATNAALQLAKKQGKKPREAAEQIVAALKKPSWVSRVEIAGPGFINFHIAPEFLSKFLTEVEKEGENFGVGETGKGKTIATDISHPNVAKPMGVHHLLSTIIGDSLNRIFAAAGYRVIRDNYLGDWGTQFGKLIYAYKTWGDEDTVKRDPIPELLKLYVKFHDETEKGGKQAEELEAKGRAEFKKLEDGDEENRKLWKWIVELSLVEFRKIWMRLDVSFDFIHGESFYEDKMGNIIEAGVKKGIFVKGERGALIAPLADAKMPPCIIRKSDGATTYATRDLARVKYWEDEWHPDLMVNVVDMAQSLHFQQFFEVAERLGLTRARNIHVAFGRMRFPEKKMSTRKGDIVLLEELLGDAEARALKVIEEKNPDLSTDRKAEVARAVGIGAVKYAILSQNRLTDVTFTWEKALSLDGNSAPYVQYAYARGCAILRKAKEQGIQWGAKGSRDEVLKEEAELEVARLLPKFPEAVAQAAEEFKPNLICNYLFTLAGRFNTFYASLPVLKGNKEEQIRRLALVQAVTVTLKNGLELLGIVAPNEM